ncbi:hypothetical protein Ancab_035712 [Ancistrocladus abbreviatus]
MQNTMDLKKLFLVSLAIVLVVRLSESLDFTEKDLETDENLWDLYQRWRSLHTVSKNLEDKHKRFDVFKENVRYIHKVNQMDKPYKLNLNKFAHMTNDEFKSLYASSEIKHPDMLNGAACDNGCFIYANVSDIPPSIDWRQTCAVTPVGHQGQCESGWAFSAAAAVEGIHQIRTSQLIPLSVQELIDCDREQNKGCKGGLKEIAFKWIMKFGLTDNLTYPYTGKDGTCNRTKVLKPVASIDGCECVPKDNEYALRQAVASQPVSVSIRVGSPEIQFYQKGVFKGDCGCFKHGVAVVGYGATDDNGSKYWIVKNSWGTDWGEDGYIRIERDIPAPGGRCGIARHGSYPIKLPSISPTATSDVAGGSVSTKDELESMPQTLFSIL